MKKLLKKKVNVFGKTIPLFVIVLLGIGLVSALLAPYLSGMVTGEVPVESPMVAGMSLGKVSWSTTQCLNTLETDPKYNTMVDSFPECVHEDLHDWSESDWTVDPEETLSLPVMYTGQEKTFTLYLMSANIADTEIKGYEEIIVTNPLGVTCEDFESIKSRYDSIYSGIGYGTEHVWTPDDEGCYPIGNDGTQIQFGSTESTWGEGETDVVEMVVTFNNVLGTYTFTYQVIPVD